MEYMFTATAVSGSDPLGKIEIRGSNWIFPKQPQTHFGGYLTHQRKFIGDDVGC